MNHPQRIPEYLEHILDAIDRASEYIRSCESADALERNLMAQDAVLRCIQVIGEAATRILNADRAFTERHADIPWREMTTMRNRVIHEYFDVDFDIVWRTIQHDLPQLREQIKSLLPASDDT